MIIVVSDIFGLSDELEQLSDDIATQTSTEVLIIDPYNGVKKQFENEREAYDYFNNNIGLDAYLKKLMSHVSKRNKLLLLGFSVGASAIWRLSEVSQYAKNIDYGLCFYSSQIRHHTSLVPLIEMDLVFPKAEASFDLEYVIDSITSNLYSNGISEKVESIKSQYLHGFMNKLSPNFNAYAYNTYLDFIVKKIKQRK